MSYTSNIPISGDTLGGTRDRIRANFQLIASVEAVNHVAFGASGQGKHKFLQMPEVTASSVAIPPTGVDEGAMYVDVGLGPAEANLFYRGESNNFIYQITRVNSAATATFGTNTGYIANHTGGWTFLAGAGTINGMMLQYGRRSGIGASGTVTFPVAFTNPPYSVQITSDSGSSIFSANTLTTTGFNFTQSPVATTAFYWVAIGV